MRRLVLVHLIVWVALAAPALARAQTLLQTASSTSSETQSTTAPQTPAQPAAAPAPAAGVDTSRSLFDPMPRQFQFGGRASSVDGDPARFQRYQDIRDGILFTDARYFRNDAAGAWLFRATADNLGWRDQ